MSTPPNPEVTVLNAALELRPEERAAYLDKACAGDADLRRRVEELLQAHEQAADFLESSAATLDRDKTVRINVPLAEKPGDKIGHYKLLQQIGEGGCGVVYMAEQEEPVRRRVALKVIKLGMDTKSVIARFEAERQALALMDHPNIARVFDAGATGTGRPYFVMELVRGIKMTDFCDENKVSTEERLNLFIQVCQAIQHAHQKGIIHRDIKPSNILVTINDGVPVPKVIDFGIAKATQGRLTDQTLFTAFEQFLGTPAYMSPEQAVMTSLDIDTRSDIYSLGVLLYELLTGKTPFEQKDLLAEGLDEMRRTIREKEPPKPSTRLSAMANDELTTTASRRQTEPPKLVHTVRGDLDWIVMKCLAKERTRRYETATGLARDIERHLHHEPVTARPPSRLYEFRKTVRRHRVGFAAAAAVSAALAIGMVVSTLQLVRARRAEREQIRLRQQAEQAQSNEARLRSRAETGEQKAKIEAAKSQQVAQFLKDMLHGAGPSVARGRDTTILHEILDKTAMRVGKDFTNQPEVEIELRTVLAETYLNLELFHQGEDMAREALKLSRSLYGETNLVTARLLVDIGSARLGVEDQAGATKNLRLALAIQRQLLPRDNPDLPQTLFQLGDTLRRFSKPAEAEPLLREALAIKRKLYGDHDPSLADPLSDLGLVQSDLGRHAEAEATVKEALALAEKDSRDAAVILGTLGHVVTRAGHLGEAQEFEKQAVALDRKVFGNESPMLSWHLIALGDALAGEGRLADAEAPYFEALNINVKAWPDRAGALRFALSQVNDLLLRERKFDELERIYYGLLPSDVFNRSQSGNFLLSRADFSGRRGHWEKAEADVKRRLELLPTDHWNHHQLASLLVARGDLEGYQQCCRNILARFDVAANPIVAGRMAKDCLTLPSSGVDAGAAGKLADAAITTGQAPDWLPWGQCTKALADYRRGQFDSAVRWAQKSTEAHPSAPENDAAVEGRLLEAYMVLAMAQFQLKRSDEAGADLAKGLEIERQMPTLEGGDLGTGWMDWIIAHALMTEARALIKGKPAPSGITNSPTNITSKPN